MFELPDRIMDNLHARRRREALRGKSVEAQARALGADAMRAAIARLGSEFDRTAQIATFKCRVLHHMRLGAGHAHVRARFGRRVAMLRGYSIDAACLLVERWLREEKRTFEIAATFGKGHRLGIEVLLELRLLLRLIRRSKEYRQYFQGIVGFTLGEYQEAAE